MAVSSAIRREVRWRVTGTDPWSDIANCSPVAELRLEGLDRAKTYDVEVRDISACGAASAWVLHTAVLPDNNQRISNSNINMLRTGGIGSAWLGFSINYTSTPTSATISCTSGTLQDGARNPAYAASSVVVSGTASTTVRHWLYYDDPAGTGGTLALNATTTYSDLAANQGRINVGTVDVTFPASGTGSGGGTPGGGGSFTPIPPTP